ncbi:MAG: hypothetical protein AB1896_07180 [Thermodesulfobacteriota bacterium]
MNADIMLLPDFPDALRQAGRRFDTFLMVGQRWDLKVEEPLDFSSETWVKRLRRRVRREGRRHGDNGIDYFVFTKGLWERIPPFALGRTTWDNWLIYDPLEKGRPVVDATSAVMAIHQDHDYSHAIGGRTGAWEGAEAKKNKEMAPADIMIGVPSSSPWELIETGFLPRREKSESRAARLDRIEKAYGEGITLLQQRRPQAALEKFTAALQLCPDFTVNRVHLGRAVALKWLGRIKEAEAEARKELQVDPASEGARVFLNELKIHQGIE